MKVKKELLEATDPSYNEVETLDARPNAMFPEWMTKRLRFLRYLKPVKCACCGKMTRHHWTLLMNFKCGDFPKQFALTMEPYATVHTALTAVCRNHFLYPCMPDERKKKRKAEK